MCNEKLRIIGDSEYLRHLMSQLWGIIQTWSLNYINWIFIKSANYPSAEVGCKVWETTLQIAENEYKNIAEACCDRIREAKL